MSRSESHHFTRPLHIAGAAILLGVVSWGLLSPNAFVVLRTIPLSPLAFINDVIIHCLAYTSAAVIGGLLFANGDPAKARLVCVLLMAHGTGTELLQALIPQRTCSAMDLMANLTGVALGSVIAMRIQRGSVNSLS